MNLKLNNEYSFTMALLGYQFPGHQNNHYDANWLNVKIAVSHPRGNWSAADPAMLTGEVQQLIDWLRAVSDGKYDKLHLWFIEPCLSFHLSPETNPDKLVVEFSNEFDPPWAKDDPDEQHELEFPLQTTNLIRAARSLETQLSLYPQRTAV